MTQNKPGISEASEALGYIEPYWSSLPIYNYTLEVLKDGKIINEHDLATKSYYLFGRNKEHSDFLMENPSVSRKHAILQHKDTGQVFLYDLNSTHGTFVNKKKIQALTYIPLRPGDLFRLGESKRLFIVNGPPSLMEEEGEVKISSKKKAPPLKKLSKDEMLRRRIEMVKKIHYQRQSNVVEIHHGEGASWGMDDDPEDIDYHSESSDAEYVASLDLEQIKVKDSLTPKQRTFINKIQNLYNKIQVLQKETANIQKKETAATDITDGQKHRIQSIQSRIQEHSAKAEELESNLRKSLYSQLKTKRADDGELIEKIHTIKKKQENDEDDDDFYDRTKDNKFNTKTGKRDKAESIESYETLKHKLETLLNSRAKLGEKLLQFENLPSQGKTKQDKLKKEADDPLDAYMAANEANIEQEQKHRLTQEINTLTKEIDKNTALLSLATPAYIKIQPSKHPHSSRPKSTKQRNQKEGEGDGDGSEEKKERGEKNDRNEKNEKNEKSRKQGAGVSCISQTLKRLSQIKEQRMLNERNRITQEQQDIVDEKVYGLISDEGNEQNGKNQSKKEGKEGETEGMDEENQDDLSNDNYFTEIVRNANRAEINLEDYGKINDEYKRYQQRKVQLQQTKIQASPDTLLPGLRLINTTKPDTEQTLIGKRSPSNQDASLHKITLKKKIVGPAPKPLDRNLTEEQIETEKDFDSHWLPPPD